MGGNGIDWLSTMAGFIVSACIIMITRMAWQRRIAEAEVAIENQKVQALERRIVRLDGASWGGVIHRAGGGRRPEPCETSTLLPSCSPLHVHRIRRVHTLQPLLAHRYSSSIAMIPRR